MGHLSLRLLGPLHITLDDAPVTAFEYNKVRALLVYLAVEREAAHAREHLIGLLWPDRPERTARQNLSQALLNLREAIGDRAADPPFLLITRDTLQFNPDSDHALDAIEFTSRLAACDQHPHRRIDTCPECTAHLQQAIALYRGDFLAQFFLSDSAPFEEWVVLKREGLHQRALTALTHVANFHERRGHFDQAVHFARRQLELEPWHEEAHRQLMRGLAFGGQRAAALAHYELCRRVLQRELSVEPEAATTQLAESIRAAVDSAALAQNIAVYHQPPINLPAPPTPLIGREQNSAEVRQLLQRVAIRLVTLTGAPGIGKTRLSMEVAAQLQYDFDDGVFFVALAPIDDSALVIPAIAQTLGVKESGGESTRAALIRYLRDKRVLLVLDNFEQVVDAASHLADVLSACAEVKMLVTSRAALRIRAEQQYPVVPLPDHEAVALFVERARTIHPDFQLMDDNASLIRSICARLDGLPLAIELIAARIDVMPLADLAAQLDHRLALLTDGPRDLPQRQQTLRSAIEWSYDLLKAEEQALFARLGVFAGGGTLDAIEAVCEQSGLANITETLSALIHKSLVQAHAGSNRYTLLETMREYALEQLIARGEAAALQRRHALYLLSVAETAEAEWRTRQQATWLHRLEEDHDNLRAALTWLHRHGETETELRLAAALWKFWDLHGYLSEGRRWLEEALTTSHERSLGREAAQALAHEGAGSLAMHQGDYTAARPHYEQSLRLYQQLGHTLQVAHALNNLGMLEQRQRDRAAAEEHYRESSKLYEEMGDQLGMAWTANNLGLIAFEAGDLPTTRHWYEHCRVLLLEAGTPLNLAQSYQNMGELALYEGNFVEARAAIEESLRLFRELGEQLYLPGSLHTLGAIQKEQDDYAAALHSLNESLALQRELGDRRGIAWSLTELGDVARCQGDEQKARAYYRESLHILKDLGDMSSMAGSLFGLAYLALAHHQTKRATHLLAMAMEWRGTLPMTAKARAGYELRVSAVRAELGEQVFAKEWAHGSALTLDQAVAYALSEPD